MTSEPVMCVWGLGDETVGCEAGLGWRKEKERRLKGKMMLRVGYPKGLAPDLLGLFPAGVELVEVPSKPESPIAVDLWIPAPAPVLGQRTWPWMRGVKTVVTLMAGTEWLMPLVGPEVTVCNAAGAHNISTAEWTVTAVLGVLKYLPLYRDLQVAGDWKGRSEASRQYAAIHRDERLQFPPVLQEELHGKRVLLVGHGEIGKTIEGLLTAFGVELTRVARTARTEPVVVHAVSELDALLPEAEIVILILPHTPESDKLIGAKQLGLMRQGALLVNAARGAIVDTDALVEALNAGRIRAAVDVTDPEPLPEGHPLWKCPNLLLTPHVAGSTPEFSPRSVKIAAEQVGRLLRGEKLVNVVKAGV
jgi:phosphoglycerate dehydrogenase-like enzyme